jgi:ADP-heptose:LPS heptosyltransferase
LPSEIPKGLPIHILSPERHKDFLRGIGVNVSSLQPIVWTTTEDERFADELFTKHNLQRGKTIALFAGVRDKVRTYNCYGAALSNICTENDLAVIALGGKGDYEVNHQNLDVIGDHGINLSGKTTLRQCAAILRRCRLAVGAETGLAHIACAVGTPNVILLGGGCRILHRPQSFVYL